MRRGFVLGKFMPPHAGHVHLCETARRLVDKLTILVCWLPDDPVPGPLRLQWMREMFPDCRVIGHQGAVPQGPAANPDYWPGWRAIVKAAHPEPIDMVFAGQDYGLRLAQEVGAAFTPVAPRLFPDLSSPALRADPWAQWGEIPPAVRPHYARTICLHGPESTGKSTLSAPLAAHFDTLWVPEYGRAHCELYGTDLDDAGLVTIARTQSAMTQAALPWCNRRLIVDTDALTTAAWSLMILGRVPDGLYDGFTKADLYLLTDIDIPWAQDGGRYYPDAADRQRFMHVCVQVLEEAGATWVKLSGENDVRLATAVEAVAKLGPQVARHAS
jgi:HTH-type transcriptional repressor of NAD biosynthesis genes